MLRTTDNNRGISVSKLYVNDVKENSVDDIVNLRIIANKKLRVKPEDNPNLLIFPQKWQLGVDDNDRIFELDIDGKLTTNNIMGFIGCNETKLTISSRFYSNDNDYFLHYMLLCKVLGINVVNLNFQNDKESIHDFLPYLFPSYLRNALSQGLYKEYRRNQYNDANVRGTIDINRHIKINIPFTGKVAYTTREHSYDNAVTQLIRHTIEHLRAREYWHSILAGDAESRENISKIEYATPTYRRNDTQKIIKTNMKPVSHPFFTKYKDLQKLCLQILRGDKTGFGKKDEIHGLLFDGAWLWEEYIATILKKNGVEHRTTKKDKLFVKDDVGKNQGIIPDFIKPIKDTKNADFIGDAKYKHIDTKDNRDDYFQIITYMFRYSCEKGYIIFPYDKDYDNDNNKEQNEEIKNENYFYKRDRIIDNNGNSHVIEFGLKIPQKGEIFKEFVGEIKNNEDALIEEIKEALN